MGFEVVRREVLYILCEGASGVGVRFAAWKQHHWPIEGVHILPEAVHVTDGKTWQEIAEVAQRLDVGLIVIDTQARTMSGMNENESKDMGAYVELVRWLREATGACVLSIHHTNVDGTRGRGHSVLDGAADTILMLRKPIGIDGVTEMTTAPPGKQRSLPPLPGDGSIRMGISEVHLGPRPGWPMGIGAPVLTGIVASEQRRDPLEVVGSIAAQSAIIKALAQCALTVGLTKGEVWRLVRAQGVHEEAGFLAAWSKALEIGIVIPGSAGQNRFTLSTTPDQEIP